MRDLPTNLQAPEIAAELFVSVNTIRTHMRHLYAKLGVHTRADPVVRGRELGLLAPSSPTGPGRKASPRPPVANLPLAVGALLAGLVLAAPANGRVRFSPRVTAIEVAAGFLFGIGNVALLSVVARVGTGVGFTIAQLSLLVNASIGIWLFKVPPPGGRPARMAIAGIVIAGLGGSAIASLT